MIKSTGIIFWMLKTCILDILAGVLGQEPARTGPETLTGVFPGGCGWGLAPPVSVRYMHED